MLRGTEALSSVWWNFVWGGTEACVLQSVMLSACPETATVRLSKHQVRGQTWLFRPVAQGAWCVDFVCFMSHFNALRVSEKGSEAAGNGELMQEYGHPLCS